MEEPSDDTPSVTPIRACQLPQRGSREGCVPFIVPPKNRNVAGDFHRPYEKRSNPPSVDKSVESVNNSGENRGKGCGE